MMNQINAVTGFSRVAETLFEQTGSELNLQNLAFCTDSLDQPGEDDYEMWFWDLGEDAESNEGCTLVQLSLKCKKWQEWDSKRIRQLFLNKLGFSYKAVYMRAYFNVYNELENDPAQRVGKMRVEPVGGQLWKPVNEPDPTLIHNRLRLKIYYD